MQKKLFTRKEFDEHLLNSGQEMASDKQLQKEALDVLVKADHYNWIHQTNWLGEPILNLPQDMFALQEIIFKTKPKYIIEVGVAWGGSLLFYSSLMEILGGDKIIGIDIFIPDDLKERISSHGKLSERIMLVNSSSIEKSTINQIKSTIGDSRDVMVFIDSYHTHDHVLKELRVYSSFVGIGNYLVCGDTVIEYIPEQKHRHRPWGPGNNPKTALDVFLKENNRFEVDKELENKLLLTCNPGGYLKAIKD